MAISSRGRSREAGLPNVVAARKARGEPISISVKTVRSVRVKDCQRPAVTAWLKADRRPSGSNRGRPVRAVSCGRESKRRSRAAGSGLRRKGASSCRRICSIASSDTPTMSRGEKMTPTRSGVRTRPRCWMPTPADGCRNIAAGHRRERDRRLYRRRQNAEEKDAGIERRGRIHDGTKPTRRPMSGKRAKVRKTESPGEPPMQETAMTTLARKPCAVEKEDQADAKLRRDGEPGAAAPSMAKPLRERLSASGGW